MRWTRDGISTAGFLTALIFALLVGTGHFGAKAQAKDAPKKTTTCEGATIREVTKSQFGSLWFINLEPYDQNVPCEVVFISLPKQPDASCKAGKKVTATGALEKIGWGSVLDEPTAIRCY